MRQRIRFALLVSGAIATAACAPQHGTTALPATVPEAGPSLLKFTFKTIDDPKGKGFTELLGIDDLSQVVGDIELGKNKKSRGFTSAVPYQRFAQILYPGSTSTTVVAVNPGGRILAGYFVSGRNDGTWGFVRNGGRWTQYKDPHTPKGSTSVNELLGVNDNGIAVGFYTDQHGHDHAYELANRKFANIVPPHAVSAEATAITLAGNVAGNETLADGKTEGWILQSGVYTEFSFPGSKSTYVNGMSDGIFDNIVVGSYVDKNGTHGYCLTHVGNPRLEIWQRVDEPNGLGSTVITGMTNHHDISGWYVDLKGKTHGFVATVPD